MISQVISSNETAGRPTLRWPIALLVSAAIAISYLHRQLLPSAMKAIQADIPFRNQIKAGLDSAVLVT
jgi:ACS family hexuronate transporter-like MFS transporter